MTTDRSIEEPCEATSLTHGSEAERSGRPLRLGSKLEPDGKHITFTDGCGIGRLRLIGTRDIEHFPVKQIKRVRIIKRTDGSYAQFAVQAERKIEHSPTEKHAGIDLGLTVFLSDSDGNTVANPRHLRKAEKKLKQLQRRLSRTQKKSASRNKARKRLATAYLKVQRQREDFARKTANALIISHDLIAYENLQIANLVKNHKLSKKATFALIPISGVLSDSRSAGCR